MQDPRLQKIQEVLEHIDNTEFPINKLTLVARKLQPMVGELVRSMIYDAYMDKEAWKDIGDALGLAKPVVWRYFNKDEGPIISKFGRPRHGVQLKRTRKE